MRFRGYGRKTKAQKLEARIKGEGLKSLLIPSFLK